MNLHDIGIGQLLKKPLLFCGPKEFVLTFDDGPDLTQTPQVLDILARHGIKAVFFIVGQRMEVSGARELILRAANEGHIIGNHGYSHRDLRNLSRSQIRSEILQAQKLIQEFEPEVPLFRPPYGGFNRTVSEVAKELGYEMVLWNVDSLDWKPEQHTFSWIDETLSQMRRYRRSICLLHDIHETTVQGLDLFVTRATRAFRSRFVPYRSTAPRGAAKTTGENSVALRRSSSEIIP